MLLTGIRTVAEGQTVLKYFGANGYRLVMYPGFLTPAFVVNAGGMRLAYRAFHSPTKCQ